MKRDLWIMMVNKRHWAF